MQEARSILVLRNLPTFLISTTTNKECKSRAIRINAYLFESLDWWQTICVYRATISKIWQPGQKSFNAFCPRCQIESSFKKVGDKKTLQSVLRNHLKIVYRL